MSGRPTCETCPYWATKKPGDMGGNCIRHSPRPRTVYCDKDGELYYGWWPYVSHDDGCGEHPDFPAWLAAVRRTAQPATPVRTVDDPLFQSMFLRLVFNDACRLRDAANRYTDSKLQKDKDEFERLVVMFNVPPEEWARRVERLAADIDDQS